MNSDIYKMYKNARKLIKKSDSCCDNDNSKNSFYKAIKELIETIDDETKEYSERYEKEKTIIDSFTPEQIDHICYQIGEWYLNMKSLLEGQHNLGHMKEVLKEMICGDER